MPAAEAQDSVGHIDVDPAAHVRRRLSFRPATTKFRKTHRLRPPRAAAPVTPASIRESDGLGRFLLTAFAAGLASIFTPCVFPMIPITVSFFLNQQTPAKRDGVIHAVVFCGVIVFCSPASA